MASIKHQKILSSMPWKDPIPEYSYAGVATFVSDDGFIVAPLEKTEKFLEYAQTRANIVGSRMVENNGWNSFATKLVKRKWPHYILKRE